MSSFKDISLDAFKIRIKGNLIVFRNGQLEDSFSKFKLKEEESYLFVSMRSVINENLTADAIEHLKRYKQVNVFCREVVIRTTGLLNEWDGAERDVTQWAQLIPWISIRYPHGHTKIFTAYP